MPATEAKTATKTERRTIATTVAASADASKRSKPAHATCQWCVTCSEGNVALR